MPSNPILDNMTFNEAQVFGSPATAILVDAQKHYEYVNGKRTEKQIGTRYFVVSPFLNFDRVAVKISEQMEPIMTTEDIKARNTAKNYVYVRFDGFEARLWQNWRDENNIAVDATATKITLLPPEATKAEVK